MRVFIFLDPASLKSLKKDDRVQENNIIGEEVLKALFRTYSPLRIQNIKY